MEVLWTLAELNYEEALGEGNQRKGSLWSEFSVCSVFEVQGVGSLSVLWKHFNILITGA